MPLVGLRNGQRVIHWPGLLLFAAVFVATAGVFSLIFYWLLPLKGYAPHPRGLVVGLLVGFLLLAIKLRQSWTTPIEKLPVLDGPERPHTVWPWIGAAVGMVLLVPIVLIVAFGLTRYSARVESVSREGLTTVQPDGSLTARLPSGVTVLRDDYKSTPETVLAALDALGHVPARRRVTVLGDLDMPPPPERHWYKAVGEKVAQVADLALFVGTKFDRYRVGARAAGMRDDHMHHVRTCLLYTSDAADE